MIFIFKTLVLIGLLGINVSAEHGLRDPNAIEEEIKAWNADVEHLDLEVISESGERELFPLLPGTKCPTGHTCRVRSAGLLSGASPMATAMRNNIKAPLAMSLDWEIFNTDLKTVVNSNDYCTRRQAMARAAAMASGVALATASKPAYAAETKEVKMGSDSGLLAFVPQKISICKGDTVKWVNNKAGPHNVVFDEDEIPAGVNVETISMIDEQLGEEGESFSRSFDSIGEYSYYCEPHRGAGMQGVLIVT